MEKKVKIFLINYRRIILLGVILAGLTAICLYFLVPVSSTNSLENKQSLTSSAQLVLEAYSGKGSVKCTLLTDDLKGEVLIKNGVLRLTEEEGGQYGNVLFDGKIAYIWKSGEKKGMKVDIEKNPIAKNFISENMIKRQIEESAPECVTQKIPDNLLIHPQDIVFEDLNVNFQNLLNGGR